MSFLAQAGVRGLEEAAESSPGYRHLDTSQRVTFRQGKLSLRHKRVGA